MISDPDQTNEYLTVNQIAADPDVTINESTRRPPTPVLTPTPTNLPELGGTAQSQKAR